MGRVLILSTSIMLVCAAASWGGDSPRFRGPAGDGRFAETGLLKQWPESGPKLAWSVQGLGPGYSSPAVVNGTVYVTGMDSQNQGYLLAYDLDGNLRWKTAYGPEFVKTGPAPTGTRGTPTVAGGRVYVMTGYARLAVFEADSGRLVTTIDLLAQFGAPQAKFGFAECVLVDDGRIICTPGASNASVVALATGTHAVLWQTRGLSQPSAYAAPRLIRHGDRDLIVVMLEKAVVGIAPETGRVLWQFDFPNRFGVLPNPPLYADGSLYVCAGGGTGGVRLALAADGASVTPEWTDKTLDCQMQGTVLVDGLIYGTAQSRNQGLVCLDWATGTVKWTAPEIEEGIVVAADGMLYVYTKDGTVILARPGPEAFTPVSQFVVIQGTGEHWTHPIIAHGRLYIRHGDALMVYDIKAGS